MNEREQLCKEFTELTGGHWHKCRWDNTVNVYKCLECELTSGTPIQNNKYTDPADVLRSIIKSGLYNEFMAQYGGLSKFGRHLDSILVDLIIEQDALLKAAVEFLIERKK
jgi:hypothetical protein